MVPAKDSALSRTAPQPPLRLRRAAVGLLLLAAVGGSEGCSKMRSGRRSDFGLARHPRAQSGEPTDAYTAFNKSLDQTTKSQAQARQPVLPPEMGERGRMAVADPGPGPEITAASAETVTPSLGQPQPRPAAVTRSTAHPRPQIAQTPAVGEAPALLNAEPIVVAAAPPEPASAPTPVPGPAPTGGDLDLALNTPKPETNSLAPKAEPKLTEPAPANPQADLAKLVADARAKLDGLKNYQLKVSGQERVGGVLKDPDVMIMSIRREPKAVRLEWREGPQKGREVIYVADKNGGLIHINMADSLIPVPRMSLSPTSPLVIKNGRHPINEAGFDQVIKNLELALKPVPGTPQAKAKVSYEGLKTVKPLAKPHQLVVRVTPTGEVWNVYFDPDTKLPALVEAFGPDKQMLERYHFKDLKSDVPELLAGGAFDPDVRWGKPGGLLSRMARGAEPAAPATR